MDLLNPVEPKVEVTMVFTTTEIGDYLTAYLTVLAANHACMWRAYAKAFSDVGAEFVQPSPSPTSSKSRS